MNAPFPHDPVGALCRANHVALAGAPAGPLAGKTFVAKDLFDIAGVPTGFGQPEWLRTQPVPTRTAPAVQALLDAGAALVGKAHCDELCYSLTGENVHYGTPENAGAPGRIPGGSSNGSAAAVAAGICDIGLGSDCGGSVRIPASYCGLYGIRPTWGRVSLDGAVPFGPSFDVAGWLTRDPAIFAAAGSVLLPRAAETPPKPIRVVVATDAFALVDARVRDALMPAVDRVVAAVGDRRDAKVSEEGLAVWFEAFRTIQASEVWASVGDWVTKTKPALGPGIKERLEYAATVTREQVAAATELRARVVRRLQGLLAPGEVLCLPTSPRVAPLRGTPTDKIEIEYRNQAMYLLCIAGHSGRPQVSYPLATLDGLPLGLSVVGAPNADEHLLALAGHIAR